MVQLCREGRKQLDLAKFNEDGYIVVNSSDMDSLKNLKNLIFEKCKELFPSDFSDSETFFNEFHKIEISDIDLNNQRLKLIDYCTHQISTTEYVFNCFKEQIVALLGPDIFAQKLSNLMIHRPFDPNKSEPHRDAPLNSYYEITVWIPLVNCFNSKSMYILNLEETKKAFAVANDSNKSWNEFEDYILARSNELTVNFGQALIFWTGLFHGSRVNQENETRWTMNLRFKNVFSPNGMKDPFGFFKVFNLSPLTRIALEFENGSEIK